MRNQIVQAIQSRQVLTINYDPGERVIEPHAVGMSKDGNELLRAFQVSGASASGEHTEWKLFRLDRVRSLKLPGQSFSGPRPEYKKGDRAMKAQIFAEL